MEVYSSRNNYFSSFSSGKKVRFKAGFEIIISDYFVVFVVFSRGDRNHGGTGRLLFILLCNSFIF